jgi:hypothetical protein
MASSGMLRRVAVVRTDVSDEISASFIRVTRIGVLGTTLAVTSNRRSLRTLSHSIVIDGQDDVSHIGPSSTLFNLRLRTLTSKKSKAIPVTRQWRTVLPVRYEHHLHIKQ